MLNGLWTVEFISTLNLAGTGVLVLFDNKLLGGDSGYYYSGNFKIDNNIISGNIDVTRFDINSSSVFGDIDNFSLSFKGTVSGKFIDGEAWLGDQQSMKIRVKCNKREEF